MLKLAPFSDAPTWLDLLPGVRVQVRPITVASMLVVRDLVGKVLLDEDQEDVGAHANIALVRELARRGITGWEGVGDASGNPIPVSPENIDALLNVWPAFVALDALYVAPALVREQEGNGFSNGPAGTSVADPITAAPAA